ncbi:hypothetical protein DAPPUDRAFT_303564 [Daphnia pulex]|uniref:G-protein coupled receptors family 1 profile domain-containing protein n=1 Tax=Daphnia pulex TaxID=6669 RepID=E9HRF2_DAPPU|nr:hypothetical protein DAPPUDRAFT_303564 [Daphnia pulex]|eukprot:EFX65693.1 hypothetical protein DAPPUDRAFT_303564 [Daphnia pulex]
MEYEYNCSYFQYNNVTPPNIGQQLQALGKFAFGVGIAGTISTILLIILFIVNVFTNIKKSPARRRRLLCWITSMPMVVSILSLIIFLVPRAGDVCDIVKQIYLPFVLMHFVDLVLLIQGGEEGVLNDVVEVHAPLSLCHPPCCFFGICLRHLTFTKIRLRIVKGLVYQAPVFQFVLIVIMNVLDHAEFMEKNKSDRLYQFFAALNILAFMFGIWGFNILNGALSQLLRTKWKRYILRTKVLSAFVVILKIQNFILGILFFYNVIPCIVPYVSPAIMRKTIDAALSLLEALIFGVLFYLVYQVRDITEMKRPSKAGMLDTPSTQRRLLASDVHPTATVVVKEPTSHMNPTTNTYNGMTYTAC